MANFISEGQIEKLVKDLLEQKLGYRSMHCFTQNPLDLNDGTGRVSKHDVVFFPILQQYITRLNPDVPEFAIQEALQRWTAQCNFMSPIKANQPVYGDLRNGLAIEYPTASGKIKRVMLRVIDFENPAANDFLVVTQLWIQGLHGFRRPDILIYINGLPLVFMEIKNSNVPLATAYHQNLMDYQRDIPTLFMYNAFCVLSNAIETKIGSFSAEWEHYLPWLRVQDETEKINRSFIEQEGTSLQRLLESLFPKEKLLDYIENFILYHGQKKIIAHNHQFIGVNKAIVSFTQRSVKQGKLGVFWHTQGSGKSFSMIFLCRKIFRKYTGNFTFIIITDREDLDQQIYVNFLSTGTVDKKEMARPKTCSEMRDFLGRNTRFIFTLIQKFRYDPKQDYPVLSNRDDIIVLVDEAHRTQYADLAENMRKGLPHAQFFAFTGTPLLGQERKTNAWFGEYVSEYNFLQSIDDGATVPIYYQKQIPEVVNQNETLSDEFYEIVENLDEESQEKLKQEYTKEIEIIKRDDRLETIAQHIVEHFPSRGYWGKGMVVCVDKFTCVKMYDKVQHHWQQAIKRLVGEIAKTKDQAQKQELNKKLDYMRSVEMAVIVSEEANEEVRFDKQGLNIRPHRAKMDKPDHYGHTMEYRFKDPHDPFQLVFVCAMWCTGFDVPTLSTLYLDKPMKGHTLMQTISRVNRVTSHKINGVGKMQGEIILYYNVFKNMQKALADYALGQDTTHPDCPMQEKEKLLPLLDHALLQGQQFCEGIGIQLQKILESDQPWDQLNLFSMFADRLLEKEIYWKEFKVHENTISSLYEGCKPEIFRETARPMIKVFQYLRGVVESQINVDDSLEESREKIAELLDQSIVTDTDQKTDSSYRPLPKEAAIFLDKEGTPQFQISPQRAMEDLRQIDISQVKQQFRENPYQHIEIARWQAFIARKLEMMLRENCTRISFAQKLQEIIDQYNANGTSTEAYFDGLMRFMESLKEEEERPIREGLTQEELELYDLLKKEKMTLDEQTKVKNAAKHLWHRLSEEQPRLLIQDWFQDSQSKIRVKSAIKDILDQDLPISYSKEIFRATSDKVFGVILDYASRGVKWVSSTPLANIQSGENI